MLESGNRTDGGELTRISIGIILFTNGTIGIIINVHNIFFMYRSKDFSTSFGYLRKARSICNIINLLVFVFYTAPITVFKYLPAGDEVGRIIALIVSPAYVTIMFIQFAVAFSRNGAIGIIINVHNVFFMYRSNDFSTSFGYLCKARSICNIINLLSFVFYTAPNTVFKILPVGDEVGRIIGLISGPSYVAITFIQFAVAFSRVIAVFFPLQYNRICTLRWAAVVVISGMLYGFVINSIHVMTGCRFVYDFNVYAWGYQNCSQMLIYFEFVYLVLTAGATSLTAHIFIAFSLIIKIFNSFSKVNANLLELQGSGLD
ncbi:hypothetical protein Y032_0005g2738 [Ancylostoma ceylanicum]|uniref:G-protein coupled receptors family 1 profile domain-containing protein n=1 Tax=Ancylostoma ceylanicum TaxID=53326 RepID=A0A016VUA4_9BILA|nr:hypothetical protein Y032_0005g2738 [Ancylostoma ceylanicum]